MIQFFREGGFPMLFILALGIAALVSSSRFAWRPDPRTVESNRSLGLALLFATLTGIATDVAAVMHHIPAHPEWAHSPDRPLIVMTGLGEAMAPAILGFALLTVQWLLVSYGFRRLSNTL